MSRKNEIFETITAEVVKHLQQGVKPWTRCWCSGLPCNYITKRAYQGINFVYLSMLNFPSPYFLTFLQTQQKKGLVNKGAKGLDIIYYELKTFEYIKGSEVETKRFPFMKFSKVFNLSQTSLYVPDQKPLIIECEELLQRFQVQPVIKHNISSCHYNPRTDEISIPVIGDFNCPEEYYASVFHESIHFTGHPSRLNRLNIESEEDKAFEELVAELGASYLCAMSGISPAVLENSAAYIQGWSQLLTDKPTALASAAALAQKAVIYLLGTNQLDQPENNLLQTENSICTADESSYFYNRFLISR